MIIELALYFLGMAVGILLGRFVFRGGATDRETRHGFASSGGSPSAADEHGRAMENITVPEVAEILNVKAEGEPPDLSRLVRLPVSELFALAQKWRRQSELFEDSAKTLGAIGIDKNAYALRRGAFLLKRCAQNLEQLIAKSAPSAAGASGSRQR